LPRIPPSADILLELSPNIRLTEVFLAKTGEYKMSFLLMAAELRMSRQCHPAVMYSPLSADHS